MNLNPRTTGITAVVGGLLWALIPLVDDIYPPYELLYGIIPILLLVSTYGLHRHYNTGREEHRLLTVGFGILTVAALIYAFAIATQGSIAFLVIIYIPAALGLIFVAIGSAFTAYRFWKRDTFPFWISLLFGVSLPLDPLMAGLVTMVVKVGISFYGISWMIVGLWVLRRSTVSEAGSRTEDSHLP